MAILISSQRQFVVDSCGCARIVAGDNRRTILPDIVSTIDGWRLDGIDDTDWLDMMESESDDFELRQPTTTGLINATAKERAGNNGNTNGEESERLANLERYALRGYAFDTEIGCEEIYRYNGNGDEV